MREKNIICKFCKIKFNYTVEDIHYGDLRPVLFLVPDYHYYLICPSCRETLVITDLTADMAIKVQERVS